ncbi:TonB-dependent receptor plug domain-containing protein [Rhodovibrio salinarum]|nr:TonB-dependent receptor [Rhodovibrio salinarum]
MGYPTKLPRGSVVGTGRLALLAAPLTLSLAMAAPSPTVAQQKMDEVVVTATRVPTRIEEVGASVTVIDRQEIEEQQYRTVTEALHTVPGLRMVSNGPRGTTTSIFMRGANSNQTLVLLDGQRISNPGTPSGAFNFADLTTDNIERIEVVRGPQSALYGSDAIAGVINIITRRPERAGVRGSASVEGGTLGTFKGSGNLRGRQGRVSFDATLSGITTDGDTITPERYRPAGAPAEDDSYQLLKAAGRLGIDLSEQLDASFYAEVTDSELDLDDNPEDPNSVEQTRRYITGAELSGHFWDGRYRPTLSLGYTDFRRDNDNRPDAFSGTRTNTVNEGSRASASFENELDVHDDHTLILGAEVYEESFKSSGVQDFSGFIQRQRSDADATTTALFLQDVYQLTSQLSGTIGVRYDKPEDFDGQVTWHVAPSYEIEATGTRLKGSVGTGFKTPSLFERFGFTPSNSGTAFRGNPDLDAEKSFGWEVGFEQPLLDSRVRFGATYFQNDIEDGVTTVFDSNFNSTTVNNADIETSGVETFVAVEPLDRLSVRVDYTYLSAEDADTGQSLVRRPKHKVTVQARWRPTDRLTLSGGLRGIAGVTDIGLNGGRVDLNDYLVARVAGSYRINDWSEITARVENLTNNDYETADGFKAPGLEAFVGTRLSF